MFPFRHYTYKSSWYPVLVFDSFFPYKLRKGSRQILLFSLIILSVLFLLGQINLAGLDVYLKYVVGFWFLLIAVSLWLFGLEAFFRSYYFDGISAKPDLTNTLFSYEVGKILYQASYPDLTVSFTRSSIGRRVLKRAGLDDLLINQWLVDNNNRQLITTLDLGINTEFNLVSLVKYILSIDHNFKTFILKQNLKEDDLVGAANWILFQRERLDRHDRWWSKDNLDRIPSLGRDWGYGSTFTLDLYAEDLDLNLVSGMAGSRQAEVDELENILQKNQSANALVLGETKQAAIDTLYQFFNRLKLGTTLPNLENKRLVLLRSENFLSKFNNRQELENTLTKILNEVARAGNVLLAIDDLPLLIKGAKTFEADLASFLEPYLISPLTQIIALSDIEGFHQTINHQEELISNFGVVRTKSLGYQDLLHLLWSRVFELEAVYNIFFTYPALKTLITSAENYLTDGSPQDRVMGLVNELAVSVGSETVVTQVLVEQFVGRKTKMPIGQIKEEEKTKLNNLEEYIHQRVIGQEIAVRAIADTMRRSRAGVRNLKRPIGSFLFLGPTGVGKTETAKALAENFFGSDQEMIRLDMSEYQGQDSLDRLIGSFSSNEAGLLATYLREHPYCVLLLDEFEKATKEVHNLFLQILDEGHFTDARGRQVNAKNTIIIATSNAGAEYIWQESTKGGLKDDLTERLIDMIVKQGIYRPELLNRFDSVIVFHPLDDNHLEQITGLMLNSLAKRLYQQGLIFETNQALISFISKVGANPVFGARPLTRAIQDNLEKRIAENLINGKLKSGDTFTFIPQAEELVLEVK